MTSAATTETPVPAARRENEDSQRPGLVGGAPGRHRAAVRRAAWTVVVVAAAVALVFGLRSPSSPRSLDAETQHIASEVRCPVCNGETVAQSQAAPAVEIRTIIRQDLQRGMTEQQILGSLEASYGQRILEKPPANGVSLLVWVLPVAVSVIGAVVVVAVVRRWRGRGVVDPAVGTVGTVGFDLKRAAPTVEAAGDVKENVEESPAPAPENGVSHRRLKIAFLVGAAVVLVGGGVGWIAASSSSPRSPGEEITGQPLGSDNVTAELQKAQDAEDAGNFVVANQAYQAILKVQPGQVRALTGEGWLLAQTGDPALLGQGLTMLSTAERESPGYGPAHVYRGLAFLSEADYGDAVPELRWYLDHNPDPKLAPGIRTALAKAQAKLAATAKPTTPTSTSPPTTAPG